MTTSTVGSTLATAEFLVKYRLLTRIVGYFACEPVALTAASVSEAVSRIQHTLVPGVRLIRMPPAVCGWIAIQPECWRVFLVVFFVQRNPVVTRRSADDNRKSGL